MVNDQPMYDLLISDELLCLFSFKIPTILEKFGKIRSIDTPISEEGITGVCLGMSLNKIYPIQTHIRSDFLLLATNQIMNLIAKYQYMFGGLYTVPMLIRVVIGRSWGQGAQHSQALQSFFMHVPGIKVVMPATPADAKGLLIGAINDKNPVMFIDDRWCYDETGSVTEDLSEIPLGKAEILEQGEDITIVAFSYMVNEALKASSVLRTKGINAEVINLRTIKPWDKELIIKS